MMFNIRCVLRTCFGLIITQFRNPRIYLGFFFAAVIAYIPTKSYLDFSIAIKEKINMLEPFIMIGSLRQYMGMIFLALLFFNSNAPFVNESTTYTIVRCNRYNWAFGCVLYIVISTIIFYIIIFIITVVMSAFHGYIVNAWSQPMYILSQTESRSVYYIYGAYFNYYFIPQNMLPISAAIKTFVLLSCYGICITGIMYIINLWFNNFLGTITAVVIHLLGYVMLSDGLSKIIDYIPLINAMLGRHNISKNVTGDTIIFSLKYFLVFFFVLMFSLMFIIKFTDYKIYSGKRK